MKRIILAMLMTISIVNAETNNTELKKVFNNILETKTDTISGKEITEFSNLENEVNLISFSSDENYIASTDGTTIKIWDISSRNIIKILDKAYYTNITSISFSSDGKFLASVNGETIIIWNTSSWEIVKEIRISSGKVNTVNFSPDGKFLFSSGEGSTIIWDISTWKILEYLSGTVNFSPNGKYIINKSYTGGSKVLDTSTWKIVKNVTELAQVSSDERFLVDTNGTSILIWDTTNWINIKNIPSSSGKISALNFSPDGKFLASANGETIIIYDTFYWQNINTVNYNQSPKQINNRLIDDEYNIHALNFSPDGKFLVSVGGDFGGRIIKDTSVWTSIDNFSGFRDFSPKGNYVTTENKILKTFCTKSKFRNKNLTNISNDKEETIGALPKNTIVELDKDFSKIFKPLNGNINIDDYEQMYINSKDISLYTLNNTPIFADVEQTKVITNIEKGRKFDKLYYSNDLNMIYIDNDKVKGWISPSNIGILKNKYNKVTVINNNTNSYKVIDGLSNSFYNSGDILEFDKVADDTGYYYSDKVGWVNKEDVMVIDESNKNKRIFINVNEAKFNNDFTGDNYKNVVIGTEYKLLGTTEKYNLVESISTGEKGWILKDNMSFTKPDLNDPVILITDTIVDDNMLTIKGKIYDDTAINSFLLNNNKMSIKPLDTFDKLGYVPEVGYSFTSQWFLVTGIENNVELKVIDRDGKTYSKVLKYTPELENINLNEFQIENIVKKLPKLDYSTELKDENGDNILTGSEKISLTVKVTNVGEGEAKNVTINLNNNSNNNLNYRNFYTLGTIQPNETKISVIEISGQDNIANGKALFDLQVNEQNGFNPFPAKLSFNVEPKLNPKLEIIDYAIDDENKNGQIEQGEKFDLYVLVQNTGEGDSKNTILEVNKKADGIIPMDETSYKYDVLKSGESKKVKFSFVTNYLYKGNGDLPFDVNLYNEKDFIKTQKPIILTMNKVIPTIKEVNLEAKKKEIVVASKISIMSDIDDTSKLISKTPSSKKWAVVIGIENYKKAPNVEYAERDALVTKEYFNRLLGVPKENTFYLSNSDATKTELETLLTSTLRNRVEKDDEVYFYFSGHGVPTNEGDSYLLLNDSDPATPQISAYSVKKLYEDLGGLKTLKSYAFLDTCFSGGVARGDEKESLLGGTRAIMKVKDVALSYNNLIVYAATGKDQLSNSFKEQNHGLFTYYLLKGLGGEADSDKDGKIGEQELQDYIRLNVTNQSRKLYGESRYQEPTLKSNGVETIITGDN